MTYHDEVLIWLEAIRRITGAKMHTRLGILGPHYCQIHPSGLLEDPEHYHGYDGLLRLHGPTPNREVQ